MRNIARPIGFRRKSADDAEELIVSRTTDIDKRRLAAVRTHRARTLDNTKQVTDFICLAYRLHDNILLFQHRWKEYWFMHVQRLCVIFEQKEFFHNYKLLKILQF